MFCHSFECVLFLLLHCACSLTSLICAATYKSNLCPFNLFVCSVLLLYCESRLCCLAVLAYYSCPHLFLSSLSSPSLCFLSLSVDRHGSQGSAGHGWQILCRQAHSVRLHYRSNVECDLPIEKQLHTALDISRF